VLSRFGYLRDPVGNPLAELRTGTLASVKVFGYDASDRLTSVCLQALCPDRRDPSIRYTYDPVPPAVSDTDPTDTNLALLDEFIAHHAETFEWRRPTAGPIGFPRVNGVADVDALCERLAAVGVLLLPGSVYAEPEHVRLGFGRANMPEALRLLEETLPTASAARSG